MDLKQARKLAKKGKLTKPIVKQFEATKKKIAASESKKATVSTDEDDDEDEETIPSGLSALKKASAAKYTAIEEDEEIVDATLGFGKHKGSKLSELAGTSEGRGYIRWIIKEGEEFPEELVDLAKDILKGRS